jgi:7-carboxy-7-deazaguanine synthase
MGNIKINEIYLSIQGESTFAGLPCVFVRTSGCPLRCSWCDTTYAYFEGSELSIDEVVEKVLSFGVPHIEATGGEPLAQSEMPELLRRLCDEGKTVLLETSGALDISVVDQRVHIIMDIKCPGSKMTSKMCWENIDLIKSKDEIKFVIMDRSDYEFARDTIRRYNLGNRCTVILSTTFGAIDKREVVDWMLADRLPARFQLQMHKYIWDPKKRGV